MFILHHKFSTYRSLWYYQRKHFYSAINKICGTWLRIGWMGEKWSHSMWQDQLQCSLVYQIHQDMCSDPLTRWRHWHSRQRRNTWTCEIISALFVAMPAYFFSYMWKFMYLKQINLRASHRGATIKKRNKRTRIKKKLTLLDCVWRSYDKLLW